MPFDLASWSANAREAVDEALAPWVAQAWPASFAEALHYPVFGGGKRVRPLLTLAAAEALGRPAHEAMPGAVAVELVHTYSLVHDDMPCMDDDAERRGRPTSHVVHGEAVALLVGDGLLTEAFAVLARAPWSAEARIDAVGVLAEAAGARGMVGGQVGDVTLGASITDVDTLQDVHARKTGALIRAAVELGALGAGATPSQREALVAYGRAVGLAFQLADDVLDADEDEGDDGPPSYVRLLGVEETRLRAQALADEAVAAVAGLPSPEALVALARFTVERTV